MPYRKHADRRPLGLVRNLAIAFGAILLVSACSGSSFFAANEEEPYIEGSVEDLYNRGTDLLLAGEHEEAARFFNEVDRQHPYSPWATRAQLMAAYSYYRAGQYETAVQALDRFIRLHPGHRDIAYAYYLKAMSYYDQIRDVRRDQQPARNALAAFQDVDRRFPQSRFAEDSRRKIVLVRDHLAGHEMEVGRFYQDRDQHLAAIIRFRTVIDEYQTTSMVPEALHRLTESYTALGMTDEARQVAAVLGYNYPASEWYVDSYTLVTTGSNRPGSVQEQGRSFFRRALDWLF